MTVNWRKAAFFFGTSLLAVAGVLLTGCAGLKVTPEAPAEPLRSDARLPLKVDFSVLPRTRPFPHPYLNGGVEFGKALERSRLFSRVYTKDSPAARDAADLELVLELKQRLVPARGNMTKAIVTGAFMMLPAPLFTYGHTLESEASLEVRTPDGRALKSYAASNSLSARFKMLSEWEAHERLARDGPRLLAESILAAMIADRERLLEEALSGDRTGTSQALRTLSSDVDAPSFKNPERPNDFALVVGVESYSSLPDAEFAARDARAVEAHLRALGVPARNLVALRGSKAGYSAMKKYLESWLPRVVTEDSRVYFYFSGHGAPKPETGDAFLLPWDGDPNFLDDTAYPVKRLTRNLESLKAKELVVALDACFSGAGGRSVLPKGARPLVTQVELGRPESRRTAVFTAAAANQITTTLGDEGHGIFTYFFLKGLGGEAKSADGRVTTESLYEYLKPRVEEEARRQNRDQTPLLAAPGPALTLY